ncbi:MAG: FAD-dependent oxidoreductase, partial [Candidatus Thermoplasmatota archaeon]
PRRIDASLCTGCGVCAQECPVEAIDDYNEGMLNKAPIFVRFPQAVPLVFTIDKEKCIGCGTCEFACKAKAIKYAQKEEEIEINVGSIIISPGIEKFVPKLKNEYGYGIYKNVVTSIEFERMLSATGPYAGTVMRPSDGEVPKKVAFIQCVGSRNERENTYCSAVCCMYATKEAIIAQEHAHGLKATIFFMDMRAFGKEFDYYYKRAKEEYGINYIRCRVPCLEEIDNNNLKIRYETEGGELKEEEFDMVVLSAGLKAPEEAKELAKKIGIKLNNYGFCETKVFNPLETSKPGIYVSGAFSSPKDIPDTVAQASGAAALAGSIISSERGKLVTKKEYPEEIDVSGQEPRIGVFICHCGINIGGVVNVPDVVEYAKTLPNVAYAENNLYTCSQDTQKRIRENIKEHKLNRVIVASCTPRTHEPLFMDTCKEAGLNPYLFEMANIRDQCSWVHMHEPKKATKKAKDLVRMAVAKARMHSSLYPITMPMNRACLVIGGGLSGMSSALNLAEQGIETYLVEKENELGGNLRHIHYLPNGEAPQEKLKDIINKVKSNKKIHLKIGSKIKSVEGFIGNFKTIITNGNKEEEIKHGAVIIATGAIEYKPTEYNYGKDSRILTQRELEESIVNKKFNAKNVVMIQCVGSRDDQHGYCSRVCCAEAMKNALKIKEVSPETNIYILYKDIRTYGFKEEYFKEAREKGIVFLRYEDENKPSVEIGDKINVKVNDMILKKKLSINADLLVLSAAIRPNPDNEEIGKFFKIPLSRDKFFLEAHMKLRPVDFATEGIFLAGLAHGPKFIDECISQAYGASARAMTVLSKDILEIEPILSFVVDENCDGCAYCVDPCPYKAITLIEYMRNGAVKKTVEVNEALCKGCGTCMATCPKKGIYVRRFRLEQLSAMVEAALESPEVV